MKKAVTSLLILFIAFSLFSKEVEELENTYVGSVLKRPQKKSMPKAMMYSIMLPGLGDFYAGNKGTGKVLLGTEVAIWLGYLGLQYYGNIQKDNYMLYSHENAGTNLTSKSEDYYDAAELYRTNEEYNEYIREDARLLYPDDPDLQNQYVQQNGYFGTNAWEWKENDSFKKYRKMRISTRETFQRATFMSGFAILNRLIAAITSSRNARNYNKKIEEMKWGIHIKPDGFGFTYKF